MSNPTDVTVSGAITTKPPGGAVANRFDLSFELTAHESALGGFVLEKGGTAAKRKIMLSQISAPLLIAFTCEATFTVDMPHGGSTALTLYGTQELRFPTTSNMTSIGVTMVSDVTALPFNYFVSAKSG